MKKQKLIIAERNPTLHINTGIGEYKREVLRLEPEGRILWFVNGKEIVVQDKTILAIAFMDVICNLTNFSYDYSKIDPELYKKYQEFLATKKK